MEQTETTGLSSEPEENNNLTLDKPCSVLLIDDDPAFCKVFTAVARTRNLRVDSFGSMQELGNFANLGNYSLVIVDYFLPNINGLEIAEYVQAFFGKTPVVMISGGKLDSCSASRQWPDCIRRFFPKNRGLIRIVEEIAEIASRSVLAY